MTLGFGLLGALVVPLLLLFLPLHFFVRLRYPGISEAEVRLFGVRLSSWTSAPLRPSASAQHRSAAPAGRQSALPAGSPLRYLESFSAFLHPVRAAPIDGLRIAARAGTGDPAATAILYGAVWAALGSFFAVRDLHPSEVSLQPVLQGPAEARASGEAQVRVVFASLLVGAFRALRVIRSGAG